jgi:hypothetical protein
VAADQPIMKVSRSSTSPMRTIRLKAITSGLHGEFLSLHLGLFFFHCLFVRILQKNNFAPVFYIVH